MLVAATRSSSCWPRCNPARWKGSPAPGPCQVRHGLRVAGQQALVHTRAHLRGEPGALRAGQTAGAHAADPPGPGRRDSGAVEGVAQFLARVAPRPLTAREEAAVDVIEIAARSPLARQVIVVDRHIRARSPGVVGGEDAAHGLDSTTGGSHQSHLHRAALDEFH